MLYLQPLRMVVECRPKDGVKFPGAWNEARQVAIVMGTPILLHWADRYVLIEAEAGDMVSAWLEVTRDEPD